MTIKVLPYHFYPFPGSIPIICEIDDSGYVYMSHNDSVIHRAKYSGKFVALIEMHPSHPADAARQAAGSWQPLRHDDPYLGDSPVWVDENGCVCWAGPDGETRRLVLYGDMKLCLFVEGEPHDRNTPQR
jgi:hypothetical protein